MAVLRYGAFYGPGATDDQVELLRRRQYPVVGDGAGHSSWVHLDDAASATVLVVKLKATGAASPTPRPSGNWAGGCAPPPGGRASRRGWHTRAENFQQLQIGIGATLIFSLIWSDALVVSLAGFAVARC
ncbi:hypothetical protein [Nonomuraea sp. B19D2]|uniref:hypothetical protein n=1 Tax=Nonomuraea sp. B19D2 TaxID=3159561 RepID=UPI0032DAE17F